MDESVEDRKDLWRAAGMLRQLSQHNGPEKTDLVDGCRFIISILDRLGTDYSHLVRKLHTHTIGRPRMVTRGELLVLWEVLGAEAEELAHRFMMEASATVPRTVAAVQPGALVSELLTQSRAAYVEGR